MEVKIQTLTPIWTGGIEGGKCDRIHETSILGSLRWWMEVLVRGMGGQVCDPTAENRSGFDAKKCDVSQIFGATGWKRRFRLEVDEIEISDAEIKHTITASRSYPGMKQPPTWYFRDPTKKDVKPLLPNTPKAGCFIIKIQSLNPNFKPEIIAGLIQFIADWSALGARPQMGFGVIQVMNENFSKSIHLNTQPLCEWLVTTAGNANTQQLDDYKHLPSLQNIFLAQITPKDSNYSFKEEDTFNLKYDLRNCFRVAVGKPDNLRQLRHFIMGAAPKDSDKEDDKMAAKIKISRPYDNEKLIRVWGWIPEESEFYKNGWDREKILAKIHEQLDNKYEIKTWHEMKSSRDTVTKNQKDAQVFLRSLL